MDDDGVDRLSSLPEALIHHIFSFLEIIDVFKMSLVSTQWRYFWRSIPFLIYIDDTVNPEKDYNFAETIMSRDKSSSIQRCSLLCLNPKDPATFYRLMDVIAGKDLQQLHMWIIMSQYPSAYDLPQCILDCESLVSLGLDCSRCLVNQRHVFPGFRRLKSLKLRDLKFTDPGLVGIMISSCPVLETLIFEWVDIPNSDIVDITAPSLKKLKFHTNSTEYQLIKIACPNLQSLFLIKIMPMNILFEEMNLLENVYFDVDHLAEPPIHTEGCCEFNCNFNKIQSVKVLIMSREFVQYLQRLIHFFPPPLNHLKCLTVFWDDHVRDLMISFLHSSPNLEVLTCSLGSSVFYPPRLYMIENISCLKYCLKTLELIYFEMTHIELLRFFLKEGHALEEVKITWSNNADEVYVSQMISESTKLPTSSPNVKFRFRDPPHVWVYDGIDSVNYQTAWDDWD